MLRCLEQTCFQTHQFHVPQKIQESGISEESLEADLRERLQEVDDLDAHDEGVASVLLVSLQGEAEKLRADLRACEAEAAEVQNRLLP